MSIYASFRVEFHKRGQHSIELCGYGNDNDDEVRFLAAYDANQVTRWLECLSKAKKFAEWFSKI